MEHRILLSADHHLGMYAPYNKETEDGVGSRLLELLDTEYRLLRLCSDFRVDRHIILGDFLNEKERINGVVASEVSKLCDAYAVANIPLEILVGNHESAAGGRRNTLEFLAFHVGEPTIVEEPKAETIFRLPFYYIPHHEDPKILRTWVKEAQAHAAKDTVLLGHLMIDGAITGSEYLVKGTFKKEELGEWGGIFLGHVHEPQDLYIGSLAQRNYADSGSRRRAALLQWDDKTPREFGVTYIDIRGPVFRTVTWGEEYDFWKAEDQKDREKAKAENDDPAPLYYRILVSDLKEVPRVQEAVRRHNLAGSSIVPRSPTGAPQRRTLGAARDWQTIISTYVEQKAQHPSEIDDLISTGLEFLGIAE
jgi:DNA repair exonuclease SbcCD nuclease subunit